MSTDRSSAGVGPSGSPLVGRGDADRHAAITRSLLGYGVLAGPVYLVAGLAQALTRDGFVLTRHDLSLLAAGSWGWIQVATFVVTGLMVVAAAVGAGRSMRVLGGRPGSVWGPRLLAGYGVGLVGAGIFVADPMNGYPPGAPVGAPTTVSAGGLGHIVFAAVGFACLVAAALVIARHYRGGMAWFSRVTGVVFLAAFLGVASGSSSPAVVLGFWAGVVLAWTWLACVSVDLYRRTPLLTPAR